MGGHDHVEVPPRAGESIRKLALAARGPFLRDIWPGNRELTPPPAMHPLLEQGSSPRNSCPAEIFPIPGARAAGTKGILAGFEGFWEKRGKTWLQRDISHTCRQPQCPHNANTTGSIVARDDPSNNTLHEGLFN